MTRSTLQPMPRRQPLPLPAPPALLRRLDQLVLAGARAEVLERELERDPEWGAAVAALRALDLGGAGGARELRDLTLAAALRRELLAGAPGEAHAAARRTVEALLAARLVARITRRLARAPALSTGELACLPLLRALARARLEAGRAGPEAVAHEAVAIARAWGLSGAAVEVLGGAEGGLERSLLDLAGRLAAGSAEPRGELGRAALERSAHELGLRSAELAELADFAASARATAAA